MTNNMADNMTNNKDFTNWMGENLIPFSEYEEFNTVITDIDSYEFNYGSFSNIDGDVDIRDDDEGYMVVNKNTLEGFLSDFISEMDNGSRYSAEQVRDALINIFSEMMLIQNGNAKPCEVDTDDIISDVITALED